MARRFWKTKSFVKLRRQWQRKLDQEGFQDIEDGEDSPPFTRPDTAHLQYLLGAGEDDEAEGRKISAVAIARYYRYCGIFLQNYSFRGALDREIWALHSEGLNGVEIGKRVRRGRNKVPVEHINTRIEALKRVMQGYDFSRLAEWSGDACEQLDNDPDQDWSGTDPEDFAEPQDSGPAVGGDYADNGETPVDSSGSDGGE